MVTILDKKIPNQLKELTVQQFEDITSIHAMKELDVIEKHLKVFELFGIAEDDFSDTSIEEFQKYVHDFNSIKGKPKLKSSIEIDDYKYIAFEGDEFKLSVKDTKHIEKVMNSRHKGYISEVLAILFKREDLTKAEHYAEAHIKHKAKMIRELKSELAVPFLVEIGLKLSKEVKQNEPTQIVE
jgi:hypothetical protein